MIRRKLQQGVSARLRTVLRFEAQDRNWNLVDWEKHTNAWGYGLAELGLDGSARALSWVDPLHTAELATMLVGSAKLGVEVRAVDAELRQRSLPPEEGLRRLLDDFRPDLLVFSPHQLVEGRKKEELVARAMGEKPPLLVHTGLYSKPGMARFRDVMLYRNRQCSHLPELDCDDRLRAAMKGESARKEEVTFAGSFDDYEQLLSALVRAAVDSVFTRLTPPGAPAALNVSLQARTLLELAAPARPSLSAHA